jgi:hypothetical protein
MLVVGSPTPTRIVWAVEAADHDLPGDRTCLVRSLTAETLLRLYGYHPRHQIGVTKTNEGMEAHSWLEYGSDVLIGDIENLSEYVLLRTANQSSPRD